MALSGEAAYLRTFVEKPEEHFMIDDSDDPASFKALVAIKWMGEHFHLVCMAYRDEEDAVFMIDPSHFPKKIPYFGSANLIEYRCAHPSMTEVSNEEYCYLGTTLVDLDRAQSWSHA